MAFKALEVGIYKAKVKRATLELLGEKEWPVIRVWFLPLEKLTGPVFVPVALDTPDANKIYFLSEKTLDRGENAGRTSIEVLREELARVYDFDGDLDPTSLEAIVGKEVQINVKPGKGEYTEVAFVNKVGDKPRSKEKKEIPASALDRLNKAFKGGATAKPAASAADFFGGLGSK